MDLSELVAVNVVYLPSKKNTSGLAPYIESKSPKTSAWKYPSCKKLLLLEPLENQLGCWNPIKIPRWYKVDKYGWLLRGTYPTGTTISLWMIICIYERSVQVPTEKEATLRHRALCPGSSDISVETKLFLSINSLNFRGVSTWWLKHPFEESNHKSQVAVIWPSLSWTQKKTYLQLPIYTPVRTLTWQPGILQLYL